MHGIFDLNSKFMQLAGAFADYVLLNLCFVLCCLPVVTIGAAKTALYRVSFELIEDRGSLYKDFFRTFRKEIGSTIGTLLLKAAVLALLIWELLVVSANPIPLQQTLLIGLLLAIWLFGAVTSSIYAQISRFSSSFGDYWRNAVYIALTHPLQSLAMGFMDLLPIVLLFGMPNYFMMMSPAWLFLYFSVTTTFGARMMRKPFEYYEERFEERNPPEEKRD